jgi:hypothetical protein
MPAEITGHLPGARREADEHDVDQVEMVGEGLEVAAKVS